MVTGTQFINLETDLGKEFLQKVQVLKSQLGMKLKTEKTKVVKKLTSEQMEENSFLLDFMHNVKNSPDEELRKLYESLELKSVSIGEFGRKAGYVNYPIKENYFRFVVHLGSAEIYFIDSNENRNKQIPMLNGFGFMISPQEATHTHFTVYSNPLRLMDDVKLHKIIPRIRPKNYERTTLIYDFAFNLPISEMVEDEKDDNNVNEQEEVENDTKDEVIGDEDGVKDEDE